MLLFSDLHLSPKTFDTCMTVLRRVHAEAKRRNVTVGFLGDFFDHVYNKGTLPVDILNELMRFFSNEWTVPMIMIPGNHDYFDASETEHGLTPFSFASPYITVLNEPKVLNNRLWVPWRRDCTVLKKILDEHSGVDVIFGHFDIIGFKLNASKISTEGLSPSMFGTDIPVYSGHYHTPQTHGNICYLGSPYQLSLSEAEDKKALVVLGDNGSILEKIPIDIGRHQYKWSGVKLASNHGTLRSGDRVSVTGISVDPTVVAQLKARGVEVHVKAPSVSIKTRMASPEKMTQRQLLEEYALCQSIDTGADAWKYILRWMETNARTMKTPCIHKKVNPVRMEISGFGPFVGPVNIPLSGNGFTLVSGEYNQCGASNGAGKSMVTSGAWLWAVTGLLDGRSTLPFDHGWSVVRGGQGTARVKVHGTFESNVPWSIERALTIDNKRKHCITLTVNNIDRTRSTLAGTQRAIASEIFGLDCNGGELWKWLLRNSVWSQQDVSRWIDASDTNAKHEIQSLANIDTWLSLFTHAKNEQKQLKSSIEMSEVHVEAAKKEYDESVVRHARNIHMATTWNTDHRERVGQSSLDLDNMEKSYNSADVLNPSPPEPSTEELDKIAQELEDNRLCLTEMKIRRSCILTGLPPDWKQKYMKPVPVITHSVKTTSTRAEQCKTTYFARKVQFEHAKQSLENFKKAGYCSQCNRPFEHQESRHEHLRTLNTNVETARSNYNTAHTKWKDSERIHEIAIKEAELYRVHTKMVQNIAALHKLDDNIDSASAKCSATVEIKKKLTSIYARESQTYITHLKTKRVRDDIIRALSMLRRNHEALIARECPYITSDDEVVRTKKKWEDYHKKLVEKRLQYQSIRQVVLWSGPRGIQTYAMEYTVQKLTALTTVWLQKFFGHDDIRLEASFDDKEKLQRRVVCSDSFGIMSGGQWRRVQLASFMAWKEMNGLEFPLLIMDEACTSMDAPGIEAVQETLKEWCEMDDSRTCFFITHEPGQHRDTSIYNNHMRIINKRGRSSVDELGPDKRRKL